MSCADAGFLGPGWLLLSWGCTDTGSAAQGMARTRVTAAANSGAQGQVREPAGSGALPDLECIDPLGKVAAVQQ